MYILLNLLMSRLCLPVRIAPHKGSLFGPQFGPQSLAAVGETITAGGDDEADGVKLFNSFRASSEYQGPIHVVLAADGLRQEGLLAVIESILHNSANKERLHFQIFVQMYHIPAVLSALGGPAELHWKQFGSHFTVRPLVSERIDNMFNFDPDVFDRKKGSNEWQVKDPRRFQNPENFARFLINDIQAVAKEDAAIWLDTDTLALGDLAELADLTMQSDRTVMFIDNTNKTENMSHYYNHNSKVDELLRDPRERAYNIGVFAANLQLWQKNRVEESLIRWARYNKKHNVWAAGTNALMLAAFMIPTPKDMTNHGPELLGDYDVAPGSWNFNRLGLPLETLRLANDDLILNVTTDTLLKQKILHWSGRLKPWNNARFKDVWLPYYLASKERWASAQMELVTSDLSHPASMAALEAAGFYWQGSPKTKLTSGVDVLPVCRMFPSVCDAKALEQRKHGRLITSLAASIEMTEDIAGVGTSWVSVIVVVALVSVVVRHCLTMLSTPGESPVTSGEEDNSGDRTRQEIRFEDETIEKSTLGDTSLQGRVVAWFTEGGPCLARPVLAMQVFVACLLLLELQSLPAPELSVLHTPELIRIYRSYPVLPKSVPKLVQTVLFDFESSVDVWVNVFAVLRVIVLVTWGAFVALPYRWKMSGSLYAIGAVCYFILGSIGLQYNLGHSSQATLLFTLVATSACGDLERPRTTAWLRKLLLHGILAPMYLLAGLGKLRFMGLGYMLNGEWLKTVMVPTGRTIWPELNTWLISTSWAMPFMSLGNFMLEIVLPIAVLFVRSAPYQQLTEGAFLMMAVAFHSMVFLLIGPNFVRLNLLIALVCEPLIFGGLRGLHECYRSAGRSAPSFYDRFRTIFSVLFMLAWFLMVFRSDLGRLFGFFHMDEKSDMYWPVPECSMFTDFASTITLTKSRHIVDLLIMLVVLLSYTIRVLWGKVLDDNISITGVALKILAMPVANAVLKTNVKWLFQDDFKFAAFLTMCHSFTTCLVAGVIAMGFRGVKLRDLTSPHIVRAAVILGSFQGLGVLSGNWALTSAGVALVSMVSATTPFFTYVGEKLVLPRQRSWQHVVAVYAICAGGILCVVGETGMTTLVLAGVIWAAASNIFRATKTLAQQSMYQQWGIEVMTLLCSSSFVGGVVMMVTMFFSEGAKPLTVLAESPSSLSLIAMILSSCVLAVILNTCQFSLAAEAGALVCQAAGSCNVVVPIIAAALVLDETVGPAQYFGVAAMVVGTFVLARGAGSGEKQKGSQLPSTSSMQSSSFPCAKLSDPGVK